MLLSCAVVTAVLFTSVLLYFRRLVARFWLCILIQERISKSWREMWLY